MAASKLLQEGVVCRTLVSFPEGTGGRHAVPVSWLFKLCVETRAFCTEELRDVTSKGWFARGWSLKQWRLPWTCIAI